MTTKHTPGPWVLDTNQNPPHVMTKDGYAIHDHPDYSSICNADEVLANARLIAAAPELLHSLEQTVASLTYWFGRYDDPEGAMSLMMKQARAAIEKAQGGNNV